MGCTYWLRLGGSYLELCLGLSFPILYELNREKRNQSKIRVTVTNKLGVANTRITPSLFRGSTLGQKISRDLRYASVNERAQFPHVYPTSTSIK